MKTNNKPEDEGARGGADTGFAGSISSGIYTCTVTIDNLVFILFVRFHQKNVTFKALIFICKNQSNNEAAG